MKSLTCFSVTCMALCATALAQATDNAKKPVFRDAEDHKSLALKSQRAPNPLKDMKALEGSDPTKENQPVNLIERSDILCFNGMATLVPKRAIIAIPEAYRNRMELQKGSQIVSWADFYARNRGWITNLEVSRKQAEGAEAINEKVEEHIHKSGKVIVATYMGGPISMLPKQETDAEAADVQTEGVEKNTNPKIR